MDYLITKMIDTLSDKKLVHEAVNSDRDYSGGGWYSDVKVSIFLYHDKTFKYLKQSFSSVSGGGLFLPNESNEVDYGSWDIEYFNFITYLVLKYNNGTEKHYETENLGVGLQRIGNQTWNRYRLA